MTTPTDVPLVKPSGPMTYWIEKGANVWPNPSLMLGIVLMLLGAGLGLTTVLTRVSHEPQYGNPAAPNVLPDPGGPCRGSS